MIETNLIGQVIKKDPSDFGYRVVDVLRKVFGLDTKTFLDNAMQVTYEGYPIKVLHPLDLLKARIENVNGILKKQTQHNADQMGLSIEITKAYFKLKIKQYEKSNNLESITLLLKNMNIAVEYATSKKFQGTAKAWDYNILEAFPIESLKTIEYVKEIKNFLDTTWPDTVKKANKITKLKTVGAPIETKKVKLKP